MPQAHEIEAFNLPLNHSIIPHLPVNTEVFLLAPCPDFYIETSKTVNLRFFSAMEMALFSSFVIQFYCVLCSRTVNCYNCIAVSCVTWFKSQKERL